MTNLELNPETIGGFVDVAREHGDLWLTILTREGVRELLPYDELPPQIVAYEEIPDYYTQGGVERRAMDLLDERPFDLIFAPREGDIIKAARLRERYGVPGQGVVSAMAYRDKLLMKQIAAAGGVAVWPSTEVGDAVDFWTALRRHGFPSLLKPRADRGGENIAFMHSEADALEAIQRTAHRVPIDAPLGYVMESFNEQTMCHADGIWHDGRLVYLLPAEYFGFGTGRKFEDAVGRPFGSLMIDPESARGARMRSFIEQVIGALPSPDSFSFHAEVWEDEDGQFSLNEIASRTGGQFVRHNARIATGADPDAMWLALLVGVDPARIGYRAAGKFQPCANLQLPYRSGRVLNAPAKCEVEGVLEWELCAPVRDGAVLPAQQHWSESLGEATIVADSYVALAAIRRRFLDWADTAIEIAPLS
jgi:hypothetical protein